MDTMRNNRPTAAAPAGLRPALRAAAGCALAAFLLAGCGYRIGGTMNSQTHSIAIAPLANETYEPNLNQYMRQALSEAFMLDGSMKVGRERSADCVLQGRVVEVKTTAENKVTNNDDVNFRTSVFGVTVKLEFVVVVPGRAKPLIPSRQVIGRAQYTVLADEFEARQNGLRQACRDAARQAVVYTTEAW